MRLLFLGDVVGRSGRQIVAELLPGLIERYALSPGRVSKYRLGLGALDYSPSLRPDTSHA